MPPAREQQQQQWQQQQQQQQMQLAQLQQQHAAMQGGGGAAPSDLSHAQLQQLQFQQMQWQYLQQMQQMMRMQQQQQQQQSQQQQGEFNPQSASQQQASGSTQKNYQAYGAYPTNETQPQQQRQLVPADASLVLPPIHSGGADTRVAQASSGELAPPRRYHSDAHAPSVDPHAWNGSIAYPSKSNPDRYLAHRSFFSDIPPVVNRLPRKPELKSLVLRGRDFYANNRDPRFYNPMAEGGWDNRAQVLKTPITPGPVALGAAAYRHENAAAGGSAAVAAANQAALSASAGHGGGPFLPSVDEAKEQFGAFPVLVENNSARPGSSLLVPFLSHWPPPFRFDYLKKHSRAPLSPFLASLNGYDVPQELFMTAKQQRELQQQMRQQQQQQQQEMEQQGFNPGSFDQQQQQHGSAQGGQTSRPSIHSSDPVERARARANTHTTYWRTVAPEGADTQQQHQPHQPKSARPEWNFRHHLKPREPRVGQTQPKRPAGRRTNQSLHSQQQQQHAHALSLQQQLMYQHQQMLAMSGGQLPPLSYGAPGQFPQFPGGQQFDPALFAAMQQQQMALAQHQAQQDAAWAALDPQQQSEYLQHMQQQIHQMQNATDQQQQPQEPQQQEEQSQQQQPQVHSDDAHNDSHDSHDHATSPSQHQAESSPQPHPPHSSTTAAPAPESDAAPALNPHAGAHVKEVYNQIYHQQAQQQQQQSSETHSA